MTWVMPLKICGQSISYLFLSFYRHHSIISIVVTYISRSARHLCANTNTWSKWDEPDKPWNRLMQVVFWLWKRKTCDEDWRLQMIIELCLWLGSSAFYSQICALISPFKILSTELATLLWRTGNKKDVMNEIRLTQVTVDIERSLLLTEIDWISAFIDENCELWTFE